MLRIRPRNNAASGRRNNAAPCRSPTGVPHLGTAQRNNPFAITRGIDPPHCTRVPFAVKRLKLCDEIDSRRGRSASNRSRRVQRINELESSRILVERRTEVSCEVPHVRELQRKRFIARAQFIYVRRKSRDHALHRKVVFVLFFRAAQQFIARAPVALLID